MGAPMEHEPTPKCPKCGSLDYNFEWKVINDWYCPHCKEGGLGDPRNNYEDAKAVKTLRVPYIDIYVSKANPKCSLYVTDKGGGNIFGTMVTNIGSHLKYESVVMSDYMLSEGFCKSSEAGPDEANINTSGEWVIMKSKVRELRELLKNMKGMFGDGLGSDEIESIIEFFKNV